MFSYPPLFARANMIVPVLFEHAINQSWRKMRRMLTKDKYQQMVPERDENGIPLLHICIAFDAPLSIIQLIHSIDNTQIIQNGGCIFDGMTPLQIACRRFQYESVKGEPDVVKFLLEKGCDVTETDDCDRVALHHALECICHDKDMWIEDALELVDLICEVNPTMIHAADKDGVTPIDMVQNARANLYAYEDAEDDDAKEDVRLSTLYLALQNVSVALYKKQRLIWERNAYQVMHSEEPSVCDQPVEQQPDTITKETVTTTTTPTTTPVDNAPHATTEKPDSFRTWKTKSTTKDEDGSFLLACSHYLQQDDKEVLLKSKSSDLHMCPKPLIKRLSFLVKKRKITMKRSM